MKLDNVYECDCCTAQFNKKKDHAGDAPAHFNVQTGTDDLCVDFEHLCPRCLSRFVVAVRTVVKDRRTDVGVSCADQFMPALDNYPKDAPVRDDGEGDDPTTCVTCGDVTEHGNDHCIPCASALAQMSSV